jgi:hypothetical protein
MLVEALAACLVAVLFAGAAASCAVMSAKALRKYEDSIELEIAKRALIADLSAHKVVASFSFNGYTAFKGSTASGLAEWKIYKHGSRKCESSVFWSDD